MTHEEMTECFRLMRTHLETLESELQALNRIVDRFWIHQVQSTPKAEEPLDSIGE